MARSSSYIIGTVLGAGYAPIAPGTAGSVVGVLLFLGLGRSGWPVQLLAILGVLLVGLWSAATMEKLTKRHDDRKIVIDELAGIWITLFALPVTPVWIISGFLLFRILDIAKPFPANWVDQRWPGAWGVIFDDVVAGIYAHVLLCAGGRLAGLL